MLIAKRERWGRIYTIIENDIPIAELKIRGWYRKGAELSVEGSTYKLSSEGGGEYEGYKLEQNGKLVAFADDSVFEELPGIVLEYRGMRYLLQKEYIPEWNPNVRFLLRLLTLGFYPWHDFKRSPIILFGSSNKRIGSVRTNRKSLREIMIDLPQKWPVALKVFIFWIVRDYC